MRQINRLSESVVSRLRSGTVISGVAQIAEELVCNSIDAGAAQIQIDVDVEACFLKVEDDGCGISRDDLTLVGERHATSKLHHLEELETGVRTLGFRGEALSSLSDIALVEITSRCRGTPNTYRKILKDCSVVSIGLCSQQRSHGTTVVVKDMFYNQPVRRRLMNTSNRNILQSVKERIVRFILMHPHISFKVTNLARLDVSIYSKSSTSLSTTLRGMFGKDLLLSLEEVDCCQGPLRLAGYLSRKYHCLSSKTVQFFYINRRFVKKSPIHKVLNKWAQSSKNGPRNMVARSTQRLTWGGRGAGKQDGYAEKHLLPAFVLNLTCPLSEYDITFEASKTMVEFKDWSPVVDFVKSVIQSKWGKPLDVPEEGLILASGRSPELSVEIDSRSKVIRGEQKSAVPYTCPKNIPPMSLRRALVQRGAVDACSPMKGSIEHRGGDSTSHSSRQSNSKRKDPASPPHVGNDGRGERRYASDWFRNAPEIIEKNLTESSSHVSDQPIRCQPWILASCGQGKTLPKPVPLSETIDLSVPCIQAPSSLSASDSFTNLKFELSPESASLTFRCMVERVTSSSDVSQMVMSPSLADTCTVSTLAQGGMEHSRDLNANHRLSQVKRVKSSAFIEDLKLESVGASAEVPDLNMGAMFWSENENHNDMTSPDFSFSLPEATCSPSNVSDVQKLVAWTFGGSNQSACDGQYKLRRNGKPVTGSVTCGPDNDNTDHMVCDGRRYSFKDYSNHEFLPRQTARESWEVNTEGCEAFKVSGHELEQPLSESSVRRLASNRDSHRDLSKGLHDESGNSSVSSEPRAKRKLEMFFSGRTNYFGSRPDCRDNLKARIRDFDRSSSFLQSKRQRRSHSGPPFYKPPSRCGLHENPPNSLSTTKTGSVDIFGSAKHRKNRTGTMVTTGYKSTDQASQPTTCGMDKSASSSFSPPFPRKGLERDADACAERDTANDCSTQLARKLGTSAETLVQLELPDGTFRGQNEAAPSKGAIENMLKEWSNPCMKSDEGVLDLSSGILCWNSISFRPDSILKESLEHARVLQQVDKKFIPAVADGVLLMIDQHAADERVRLEELRDRVLGSGQMKQTAPLSCTQELTMAFTEQQMLQTYREQIEDWGWRFRLPFGQSLETTRPGSSVVGVCNVLLSAVPCILGVTLTPDDLTEYLRQLMDTQGSSAPPPAVIRVLNYKACRGAIMFGDTLLPAESRQLVEHLKLTSLCFQCAHGRPTMVPLVDLRALNKRLLSSGSTCGNVRNFEPPSGSTVQKSELLVREWHRLQNRNSSLERSLKRLERAKQ